MVYLLLYVYNIYYENSLENINKQEENSFELSLK